MKKLFNFLILILLITTVQAQTTIIQSNLDTVVLSSTSCITAIKKYVPPGGINLKPVANAGPDMIFSFPTSLFQLNASASRDPEGSVLKYYWRKLSGPAMVISNTTKVLAIVTGATPGVYAFEVRVVDNLNSWTGDTVKVTITPETIPNRAPIAFGGSDISVTLPQSFIQLNGSESIDPDGTIQAFAWKQLSGPAVTLNGRSSSILTISNLVAGNFSFLLTVTDDLAAIGVDTVNVTINAAPPVNQAPVAKASASPSTITLPTNTVNLSAAASTDADGTIVSWLWTKVAGPPAGNISNPNSSITQAQGMDLAGVYVYEVAVTDDDGAKASTIVTVTVNPAVVDPPTGNTFSLSFTEIAVGDPDLNRPGAGAEQWHDRNDVNLGYTPQDVYYRFVATRIATSQRNVYSWSYFDGLVNAAISRKQKFSFGIMTVYPEGTTDNGLINIGGGTASYPAWLQSAMSGEWLINGTWIPNYNDPAYLAWVLELNQAIYSHIQSTSFNGVSYKNVINSIDIRSYGSWGEWHSCCTVENFTVSMYPSGTFPTAASLKKIVDAYTQGFPDIQLSAMIAGYDANWLNNTNNPSEIAYYLLTQRNQKGMIGWRRDQWGATDGYLSSYLENNTRSFNGLTFRDSIMVRYKTAPVTGEPPAWIPPTDYSDLENQIRRYHATSFGNGNYGTNSPNSTIQSRVKASSKAAGHRLVLKGGSVTTGASSISITMNWQNIGLAPTYDNWNIIYELVNSSGAVTTLGVSSFKLRLFLPASSQTAHKDVFPLSVPSGTYTLRVVVKDAGGFRSPAVLNIQGRNSDGSYNLKTGVTLSNK